MLTSKAAEATRGRVELKKFERRVKVRPLTANDYDAVVKLQQRCFSDMEPWDRDQFESQLQRFPEGQIGVEVGSKLVASCSSLIVDYSDYTDWHHWREISDDGYIRNHDAQGDTLYGIEIMVDPDYRGLRLARRMYDARQELCREKNLARMIVGGRIPGYAMHAREMTVQDYVRKVIARELRDPVLTVQLANGFQLRQIVPDYLEKDRDSGGHATCLEWPNFDHRPMPTRRGRRAIDPVRVALVQYPMHAIRSFEDFARQSEFYVAVASEAHADFLLFPELFTPARHLRDEGLQLLSTVKEHQRGLAARKLAELTPRYLELFATLAVKYDVNIIGGSQFAVENDELYNVSYLFRRDGTLGKQFKLHVTPNERKCWGVSGGGELEVFDTDRGPIAILVCYDVEFPELARVAVERGANLLFVPYNTSDRHGHLRVRYCAQARCIENQVYTVTAGCVGSLPFVENADLHYAQSGVFTPADSAFARDGVAGECDPNVESVLTHDLDLELLRRARRAGTVQHWQDRRTDVYEVRWKPEKPRSGVLSQ